VGPGRRKADAWNQHPADGEGEKCPRQRTELYRPILPDAWNHESDACDAVKHLSSSKYDAEGDDSDDCFRAHDAPPFYGLTDEEFVRHSARQAILAPQESYHTILVERSRSEREGECRPADGQRLLS
jgi:hypothetical protein